MVTGRPAALGFTRSRSQRMVAGVCGGIAEATGKDVLVIRLLCLLAMAAGFGFVAYLALWYLVPDEGTG